MALNVDDIATDADLATAAGDIKKLQAFGLSEQVRNQHRAQALEDFLSALTNRSPPIFESDVQNPAELKMGVVWRALHLIARQARGMAGDTFDLLSKDYARDAASQFSRTVTVSGNLRGPSGGTFRLERR